MRSIDRVKPGCVAGRPGPGFPRSACSPESDTSLDYRERTISRAEVAVLANGLISAEALQMRTAEQAGSRARTAAGKWFCLGVGR